MNAPALLPSSKMTPYYPENTAISTLSTGSEAQQTSSTIGLRQQLSRQEWEVLKPLIERLYIEEDRTFAYIADFLSTQNKFRPTEKQFKSKAKEWGFKKYTSKQERRAIVQNLRKVEGKVFEDMSGCKHSKQKLTRWLKEVETTGRESDPSAPASASENVESKSSSTPITSVRRRIPEPLVTMDNEKESEFVEAERGRRIWVQDEEYQYWPFALWANVDVQGSPKLTRLFESLAIKTNSNGLLNDIESLVLPAPSFELCTPSTQMNVTPSKLTNVCGEENGAFLSCDAETSFLDTDSRLVIPAPRPFRFANCDAWFPSGSRIEVCPSPFRELYPFPTTLPLGSSNCSQRSETVTNSHKIKEQEYSSKLEFLKMAGIDETHPVVIEVTRRLALALYNQGKERQAEVLYRKLLSAQSRETGQTDMLAIQIDLIDSICDQGRFLEAREMHKGVHESIVRTLTPHHPLFRRSLISLIRTCDWMCHFEEKESLCRQLVQISLIHFGPRDPASIHAMSLLAIALRNRKGYTESEKLACAAIQLYQKNHANLHDDICSSLMRLGELFERQTRFEDAINIYRISTARAKESLGEEHPITLSCHYYLGRVLPRQEQYEESQELLEEAVRLQTQAMGEDHPDTLSSMNELGKTLQHKGDHHASMVWLEKAFWKSLVILGPCHCLTINCCGFLGLSYEDQGLFVKALGLYKGLLGDIEAIQGGDDQNTLKIRGWINDVPGSASDDQAKDEVVHD